MVTGPSRYGGVAAVLVLGIGLLLVGKIAAGLAVLAMGVAAFALILRPNMIAQPLVVAIITIALTALISLDAINAQRTGTYSYRIKNDPPIVVTRAQSPDKFRAGIKGKWEEAGVVLLVGTILLLVACKRERAEYDY